LNWIELDSGILDLRFLDYGYKMFYFHISEVSSTSGCYEMSKSPKTTIEEYSDYNNFRQRKEAECGTFFALMHPEKNHNLR